MYSGGERKVTMEQPMARIARSKREPWQPPRLECLGDLGDIAGSPAPLLQVNPGGQTPTAGKS